MNSRQRRRLRKQLLPKLLLLIATKRLTGELHPFSNIDGVAKAAAKNPQHIRRVMQAVEDNHYFEAKDFERVLRVWGKQKIRRQEPNLVIVDEYPLTKKHDDLPDAIKYVFAQTFRTPKEVLGARQKNPGSI